MAPKKYATGERRRSKAMKRDNKYFVEAIIDERVGGNGETEYRIQWDGYPLEEATWESVDDISNESVPDWEKKKNSEAAEEGIPQPRKERTPDRAQDASREMTGRQVEAANRADEIRPTHSIRPNIIAREHGNVCIICATITHYLLCPRYKFGLDAFNDSEWVTYDKVDQARVRDWNVFMKEYAEAVEDVKKTGDSISSRGGRFLVELLVASKGELLLIRRKHPASNTASDQEVVLASAEAVNDVVESTGAQLESRAISIPKVVVTPPAAVENSQHLHAFSARAENEPEEPSSPAKVTEDDDKGSADNSTDTGKAVRGSQESDNVDEQQHSEPSNAGQQTSAFVRLIAAIEASGDRDHMNRLSARLLEVIESVSSSDEGGD